MRPFHVSIEPRPSGGSDVSGPAGASRATGSPPSFEEVAGRLEQLPRLFFEPDGSFVWVGTDSAARWQVDGLLNDGRHGIASLELKGTCPAASLDELLGALGWPAVDYQIRFVEAGETICVDDFRRANRCPADRGSEPANSDE